MTTDFAGDPIDFPALITAPSDGELRNAVSVQVPYEQLADRTAFLQRNAPIASKVWTRSDATSVNAVTSGDVVDLAGSEEWWVTVGSGGIGDASLYVSTGPGSSWAEEANPKAFTLNGVAYVANGDVFVAVGAADGTDAYIITATDPSGTWTERTNPQDATLNTVLGMASGNIVAAGPFDVPLGVIYAVRSTNAGVAWAQITIPGSSGDAVEGFASNGTTVVAVGGTSGAVPLIWSSTDDGATFTARAIPGGLTDDLKDVTWDGTKFVALGDAGQIATSTDGTTWAMLAGLTPDAATMRKIKADPISGTILATGPSEKHLHISTDTGTTWSKIGNTPMRVGGVSGWATLGFNGVSWAMSDFDAVSDTIAGALSGIMG